MLKIPHLIYGTAWKEEATEELVLSAIKTGYRNFDTANQRRHYVEVAVGDAILQAYKNGFEREDFFLQTKYTFPEGQDERLPYDLNTDYDVQVRQSFDSSLEHLQTTFIDSYLLHGPSQRSGLDESDWMVWTEMESIFKEGLTRSLGVSNVSIEQLKLLYEKSEIKPTFVQNRCFAQMGWDWEVRKFCRENQISYQGFSLLTANPFVLPILTEISQKLNKTPAQIIFRFAIYIGIIPLTGTTNLLHMEEDISLDFTLEDSEIDFIEKVAMHFRER
jgi:diketogulonate reductase-like aldo/keto reductase|tara:strand:+ start:573 stop:1397 length:825 start_codon:yes stop_codon:yes gene_type:complete